MPETIARALSSNRKKRGTVKASLTRLSSRLRSIESTPDLDEARRLTTRLECLVAEFKVHHFAVLDLIDDEENELEEQRELDKHEDVVADLTARLDKVVAMCLSKSSDEPTRIASKHLTAIDRGLDSILENFSPLPCDADAKICLLQQCEERLSELKSEFLKVRNSLFLLDLDEHHEVNRQLARTEGRIFDCSVEIKKLLCSHTPPPSLSSDPLGVKLPKLDVPTFDGGILSWKTFWEQFSVSVDARSNLSDSEKLAYLRHALKGGSAKAVIEGLSRSGDHYGEAIACLKARYDRPRLIHQAHVQKILEAPSLKDGSGRELRRLHDTVLQHLRALKSLDHEPSGSFITSLLELKFDAQTMFEWQRHSQDSADVPHYQDILDFIDLRAQASESLSSDTKKLSKPDTGSSWKRGTSSSKPVASFVGGAESSSNCVVCKTEKHPLHMCPKFKSFDHEHKTSMLKSNSLCINCMKPGHFVKNCKSLHRCKVCQKPHHTLLHLDEKTKAVDAPSHSAMPNPSVLIAPVSSSHVSTGIKSDMLLMTCRVHVEAPDGSTLEARALLDSGSSASFISERLAQSLHLPRSNHNTTISGVAGFSRNSTHSITSFSILSTLTPARKYFTTAVVVPRVTCDLPLCQVHPSKNWSHLSGLQLADLGQPGRIDLLLGVDIFAEVMLDGRRTGGPDSPVAFETQFLLGVLTLVLLHMLLQYITLPFSLEMISYNASGRLRRRWPLTFVSRKKRKLRWITSTRTTVAYKMVVLLSHYP